MTIKELEALVDMTRANIRFYEQEGLISPARQPNGYRDYSQEDADTLSKIKLFRQLHLDLDTIRKLQSGELTLDRALEEQLTELEADQDALDRARQVCRQLRESGASYAALDPRPWLAELERPPAPGSARYAPPEDRYVPPESARHPWRRYFARMIDLVICGTIRLAVFALCFHWNQPRSVWTTIFNVYVEWGLLLLLEPLLLHFWGTTPGKAVFGISIRNENGEKLTWKAALNRTWQVFVQGYGLDIPIYNLWRLWKSYKACQEGEREPWESGETYDLADDKVWRCLACVGVYILNIGLMVLIMLQALMPPNRGPLTVAEFYENYNFYVDYLHTGGYHLGEDGLRIRPEESGNAIQLVPYPGTDFSSFSVTLTDGVVTGVTIIRQTETDFFLWLSNNELETALLAFAGSLPEVNCFTLTAADWLESIDKQTTWDYDVTLRGLLRVTQSTQLDGFKDEDQVAPLLLPLEGQTATFHQTFHIERIT